MANQSGINPLYTECSMKQRGVEYGPSENLGQRNDVFSKKCVIFLYGSEYVSYSLILISSSVRSDQGGSRNLFSITKYANKDSDVTLVVDD